MEGSNVHVYLGRVTYIIDLDYFFMHIGTAEQLQEFSVLEESIEIYCQTSSCTCIESIEEILEGQLVLVDCSDNYGCWRRGQITRIDRKENKADVFYIDYGETENISEDRICSKLLPEFQTFPAQGLRCCIAGIRPIARKWTTRAIKIFEQHTQIKKFNTVILKTENETFKVALYSRDGKQRCLSKVLVEEELGFPVEDEVTEFFEDVEEFYANRQEQSTSDGYYDYNHWNGKEDSGTSDIQQVSGEFYPDEGDPSEPMDNDDNIIDSDQEGIVKPLESNQAVLCDYLNKSDDVIENNKSLDYNASLKSSLPSMNNNSKSLSGCLDSLSIDRTETSSPFGSMLLNITAALQSTKNSQANSPTNNNNSVSQASPLSPEIIPQFNLESLHKTHKTTTDKLLEKKHKQMQENLKKENERVKLETVEQSKLAVAAGYGGLEDIGFLDSNTRTSKLEKEDWDKELLEMENITSGLALKELPPPPPMGKRTTPHGRELLKILNQIFADSEREPVDEIRVRLRSLFGTDTYLFLNREEMGDLMETIVNRAVRYYGVMHDIILEILEILSSTQFFQECLLQSAKRVQDMYIKIQYKGRPFHVQCSKILGHLFNMSFHWSDSISLQEYVVSLLEKWIMFNKKATQIGTDRLQEIYLECFETIWEISGDALLDLVENVKSRLLKECEDKILNTQVSKNIRSRTLHIYVLLNIKQQIKVTENKSIQTDNKTSDVCCQTDTYDILPERPAVKNVPRQQKSARMPFYPPKSSKYYEKPNSRSSTPNSLHSEKTDSEDSWPTLSKSHGNVIDMEVSKMTKKSNRQSSPSLNQEKRKGSPCFTTDRKSPSDVLLLTPASFTDTYKDNSSSQEDSSIYYSLNENFNNSSINSVNDDLLKPVETKESRCNSRDVSPLSKLIEIDSKATFEFTDKAKDIKSKETSYKQIVESPNTETCRNVISKPIIEKEVPDWWDVENTKVKQTKIKDHWDISDSESSENISVKSETLSTKLSGNSETLPPKSLDDLAHWMLKSSRISPQVTNKNFDEKDKYSLEKKEQTQTSHPTSTYAEKVKPGSQTTTKKNNTKFLESNPSYLNADEGAVIKEKKDYDWFDLGVDESNDTDKENDDDGDWESYTSDDNSQDKTSESLSELPIDTPLTDRKPVTIVRDYQPAEKPKPTWKPTGGRKCTACGDPSHLIYDCPNKHKRGFFY